MRPAVKLRPTRCAICGTPGNATVLYPANFDPQALNPAVFSARRLPDRLHYRMVTCNRCGLVRSDPMADASVANQLYERSAFTYSEQVVDLRKTYGHSLAKLDHFGVRKGRLLEIGCGNGFLLEQALEQGYQSVWGVEPSREAVSRAAERVRPQIICDIMRPGLFRPSQFDAICLFQVFDHIADPAALLHECFQMLQPGGFILAINHNVAAFSARLFRERSPIIDIEHTYLYTPATMSRLFSAHGFEVLRVGSFCNRYSLLYLTQLLPLPLVAKRVALAWLRRLAIGQMRLWLPLGNLYLVAQKPGEPLRRCSQVQS